MKTANQLMGVSAAMALVLIVAAHVQAEDAPPAREVPQAPPCVSKPERPREEVKQEAAQAVKEYRSTLARSQDQMK